MPELWGSSLVAPPAQCPEKPAKRSEADPDFAVLIPAP